MKTSEQFEITEMRTRTFELNAKDLPALNKKDGDTYTMSDKECHIFIADNGKLIEDIRNCDWKQYENSWVNLTLYGVEKR